MGMSSTFYRGTLTVFLLSWNINGLSIEQKESSGFVNVILENDLCFLYESWTTIKSNVYIDGFVCHYHYQKVSASERLKISLIH